MPFSFLILDVAAEKLFQARIGGEVDIVEVRLFLVGEISDESRLS